MQANPHDNASADLTKLVMQAQRLAAAQRTSALSGTLSLRPTFGGLTAQMAPQTMRWTTGEAHTKLTCGCYHC